MSKGEDANALKLNFLARPMELILLVLLLIDPSANGETGQSNAEGAIAPARSVHLWDFNHPAGFRQLLFDSLTRAAPVRGG